MPDSQLMKSNSQNAIMCVVNNGPFCNRLHALDILCETHCKIWNIKTLEIPALQATSLTLLLLEMPICVYVGVDAEN